MSDDQTVNDAAGGVNQAPPAHDPQAQAAAAAEILRTQAVPDENPMEPVQLAPAEPVAQPEPEPTVEIVPPAEPVADTSGLTDFQRAMEQSANQANTVETLTAVPADAGFLSRDEAQKNVAAALGEGVEIWLPKTGSKALVRDLPFTDYVMLQGIPTELIKAIDDTVRDSRMQEMARTGADAAKTLGDALEMWSKAEQTANAVCISSFIKPKLVMRESELDPNNPLVWLVTDVALEDRLAVLQWSNRNRQARVASQGGAVAVAGFPG